MMIFNTLVAFLLLPFLAVVSAKSHDVSVGKNGLTFTPGTINAKPGDKVHFHFYPGHHAVAEGLYKHPCKSARKPIFSGFIDSNGGVAKKMFTITVKDKKPTWFYCPSDSHCQSGMGFAINPGKGQRLASYRARAATSGRSQVPKKVRGGKISKNRGH